MTVIAPEPIQAILNRAREYDSNHSGKVRHHKKYDQTDAQSGQYTGRTFESTGKTFTNLYNPADILTPKELAERLKVPEGWIFEKTRARCDNPIPCLHMGRFIRFDWPTVVGWLESEAVSRGNTNIVPAKTSRSTKEHANRTNHSTRK